MTNTIIWKAVGTNRAHRAAWILFKGPIPEGKMVCHDCDNIICVNWTECLWLGTHDENMKDAARKGRTASGDRHGQRLHPERVARGERHGSVTHPEKVPRGDKNGSRTHPERLVRGSTHPNYKITDQMVYEIRRLHATGKYPYRTLETKFNLSGSSVKIIVRRRGRFAKIQ